MMIASRILKLRDANSNIDIPIEIFAPEQQSMDWVCRFEIGWPDGKLERHASGFDAVQALLLALQMIGTQIYASDLHASGNLEWLKPGFGYGFPVPAGIRDLLIGDDK